MRPELRVRELRRYQLNDLDSYLNRLEPPNWESLFNEIERKAGQVGRQSPFGRGFLDAFRKAAAAPNGHPTHLLMQRWGESVANPTIAELRELLLQIARADCVEELEWLRSPRASSVAVAAPANLTFDSTAQALIRALSVITPSLVDELAAGTSQVQVLIGDDTRRALEPFVARGLLTMRSNGNVAIGPNAFAGRGVFNDAAHTRNGFVLSFSSTFLASLQRTQPVATSARAVHFRNMSGTVLEVLIDRRWASLPPGSVQTFSLHPPLPVVFRSLPEPNTGCLPIAAKYVSSTTASITFSAADTQLLQTGGVYFAPLFFFFLVTLFIIRSLLRSAYCVGRQRRQVR
jgi:hypothetical protein